MLSPFWTFFLLFALLYFSPFSNSLPQSPPPQQTLLLPSGECNEKCGKFHIPFPFYSNTSCILISDAFHLSCSNSTTLYLTIQSQKYRVIEFFSDGVLVDFPDISACRQYNDLNSFGFSGNSYFGISVDNVIGLYDCEDSSLCKAGCETNDLPDCNGNGNSSPACCYPLSDKTQWDPVHTHCSNAMERRGRERRIARIATKYQQLQPRVQLGELREGLLSREKNM